MAMTASHCWVTTDNLRNGFLSAQFAHYLRVKGLIPIHGGNVIAVFHAKTLQMLLELRPSHRYPLLRRRTTQLCGGPLDWACPIALRRPVRSSTWFGAFFLQPAFQLFFVQLSFGHFPVPLDELIGTNGLLIQRL